MPWQSGIRYVTPNGSSRRRLWVTAKSDKLPMLKNGPQILFLNKDDLFQAKIRHSDIKTFFPVYLQASKILSSLRFIRYRTSMENHKTQILAENTSRSALQGLRRKPAAQKNVKFTSSPWCSLELWPLALKLGQHYHCDRYRVIAGSYGGCWR